MYIVRLRLEHRSSILLPRNAIPRLHITRTVRYRSHTRNGGKNISARNENSIASRPSIVPLANKKVNEIAHQNNVLLEDDKSNRDQRKADWKIMREMARYLWPRVCLWSRFR